MMMCSGENMASLWQKSQIVSKTASLFCAKCIGEMNIYDEDRRDESEPMFFVTYFITKHAC